MPRFGPRPAVVVVPKIVGVMRGVRRRRAVVVVPVLRMRDSDRSMSLGVGRNIGAVCSAQGSTRSRDDQCPNC